MTDTQRQALLNILSYVLDRDSNQETFDDRQILYVFLEEQLEKQN